MFKSPQTVAVMADALEIAQSAVTADLALGSADAWTSLSHMRLIFALEDVLNRRLSPDEIVSLTSVARVDEILCDASA